MRHAALRLAFCCASIALLAGCAAQHAGPQPELMAALDSRSDCETRYTAAGQISTVADRDLAYSQIALSAVDCRNDQVLRNSIDRITDPVLHDNTAYRCAIGCAKAGNGLEAATIANSISNSELRAKATIAINQTSPAQ